MNPEEIDSLLNEVVTELGNHFDHVQVMVSWNEESTTRSIMRGAGNWYARQGMAHDFIQKDIAQENAHQLAAKLARDEEE